MLTKTLIKKSGAGLPIYIPDISLLQSSGPWRTRRLLKTSWAVWPNAVWLSSLPSDWVRMDLPVLMSSCLHSYSWSYIPTLCTCTPTSSEPTVYCTCTCTPTSSEPTVYCTLSHALQHQVSLLCTVPRAYKEKRACNSPWAKTLWAEEWY